MLPPFSSRIFMNFPIRTPIKSFGENHPAPPGSGATRTFRHPEAVATARTRQGVVAVLVIAVPVHFLAGRWEQKVVYIQDGAPQ